MSFSQIIVVTWIQFALSATVLLYIVRKILGRLNQPADRIRLIQNSLFAVVVIPLLIVLAPLPAVRLQLVTPVEAEPTATLVAETELPTMSLAQEQTTDPLVPLRIPSGLYQHGVAADVLSPSTSIVATPIEPDRPRETEVAQLTDLRIVPTLSAASPALTKEQPNTTESRTDGIVNSVFVRSAAWKRPDLWTVAASIIVAAHVVILGFTLFEWIVGAMWLRRVCRLAKPSTPDVDRAWQIATEGKGDHVRLLISSLIDSPLMFGCVNPVVLVPREIADAGGSTLQFCLTHEWSHIERLDLLAWRSTWACQLLLWFQPFYWAIRKELRVSQDMLADDRSSRAGTDSIDYAELLVGFARRRFTSPVVGALTLLDQPSQLKRRVKMILNPPALIRAACPWTFSIATATALVTSVLLVCGVRFESTRSAIAAVSQSISNSPSNLTSSSSGSDQSEAAQSTQATLVNETLADSPEPPVIEQEDDADSIRYACRIIEAGTHDAVSNAKVLVRFWNTSRSNEQQSFAKRYTSDDNGDYWVSIPSRLAADPTLRLEFDVEHDEFQFVKGFTKTFAAFRKNEQFGDRPFFEQIVLRRTDAVSGQVVDAGGIPLAGVKVEGYSIVNQCLVNTTTDAEGRFQLKMLAGEQATIWAIDNDHGFTQRQAVQCPAELGTITLSTGTSIHGRLLDADNYPIPSLSLEIRYAGNSDRKDFPYIACVHRNSVTDADGQYAFAPLPAGDYWIVANPLVTGPARFVQPSAPSSAVFLPTKVTVNSDGETPPFEIHAVPHVSLNGRIIGEESGRLGRFKFHITGAINGIFWGTNLSPDEDGRISLNVPNGLTNVQIHLVGDEHRAVRFRRSPGTQLQTLARCIVVGPLSENMNDFELVTCTAPIAIVSAVDEDQHPISEIRINAEYSKESPGYNAETACQTEVPFTRQDDGRYRSMQMLPDEDITFSISAPGYTTKSETCRFSEGETKALVLTLKKAAPMTRVTKSRKTVKSNNDNN